MPAGRPSEYKEEYIKKVDEYLSTKEDEEIEREKKDGWYEYKLRANLPTIEGFARFIGVNKTSLYEWEKKHPKFSNALEEIRVEQKERLINYGLSGDYNSTIAKLILSSNHGMSDKQELDHTSKGERIEGFNYVVPNNEANDQTLA